MSRMVFLLEEYSMKVLLDGLLPRLLPDLPFLCIPHEGKQDLEKSVPRKLKAWREPGTRFVVIRDNDGGDCLALKDTLTELCLAGNRDNVLVRSACQELEAWYIGEPDALADAYGEEALRGIQHKARIRTLLRSHRPYLRNSSPVFRRCPGRVGWRVTYPRRGTVPQASRCS